MKDRKDSWTPEDDMLLAQTVLKHVRAGSTQLKAFEEVSEALGRTDKACGFRWNSEVRKRFEEALQAAKMERKQQANSQPDNVAKTPTSAEYNLNQQAQTEYESSETFDPSTTLDMLKSYIAHLEAENGRLINENERLKEQNMTTIISVLDRARKSGKLDEWITDFAEAQ